VLVDHLDGDFNVIMVSLIDRDFNATEAEKELRELQKSVKSSLTPSATKGGRRCCA